MIDHPAHETPSEPLIEGRDYVWEGGLMVLTADYLRRRGTCCHQGCRNCPYDEPDASSGGERTAGRDGPV